MTSFEFDERQRRWVDALLILATIIAFIVAMGLIGGVLFAFGDVILVFFPGLADRLHDRPARERPRPPDPGLNRAVAVVLVYVILFVAIFALLFVITDTLVGSINEFIASIPQIREDLPEILAPFQQSIDALGLSIDIEVQLQEILRAIQTSALDILCPLQEIAVAGIGVMGNVLIIVILSLYIAVDRTRLLDFLLRLVPPRYKEEADLLQRSVSRSFGGFIRGQVLLGATYGAIAFATSLVLGLDFSVLTSFAAGLLMAIPFFGPFVAWAPPVLVAIFFDQPDIIPALVIMGAGWFVVMNILQPRVMADAVGLHPIVVLASVILGIKIAGIAGAIFGIPIAAIISAFFFYYMGQQRGETVAERAARRLEGREGRPIRVPREPTPGRDADVEEPALAATETLNPAPQASAPAPAPGQAPAPSTATSPQALAPATAPPARPAE
jgi:predicted PurR-regulated permease PerM